jgi:hypothetical protein
MNRLNILAVILAVIVGILGYRHFVGPQIITVVEYETQEIDENLWVSRSQYLTERQLVAQLRADSSRFAQELSQTRQRLLQSSEITARLRFERDSLASVPNIVQIRDNKVDTVFTYVFNDSLLAVHASVKIDSTRLEHGVEIEQLRPIRLNAHTTQDVAGVYFYVESKDLQIEEINTFTTIDIPRYKWYHYLGAGIVTGVITWELLR